MKVLERQDFLQKLINTIYTPDIKVITGIRRSGKSKLLEMFIENLKNQIPDANIIHINYNLFQFSTLKNAAALNEYVENLYLLFSIYSIFPYFLNLGLNLFLIF